MSGQSLPGPDALFANLGGTVASGGPPVPRTRPRVRSEPTQRSARPKRPFPAVTRGHAAPPLGTQKVAFAFAFAFFSPLSLFLQVGLAEEGEVSGRGDAKAVLRFENKLYKGRRGGKLLKKSHWVIPEQTEGKQNSQGLGK